MRATCTWSDSVPERDNQKSTVWDLAFSPDGNRLVAAAGSRVLVYESATGDLAHSLKSHKDTVYTVDYSADGELFASGGADNTVIIWTKNAEGVLKFSHTDSIQKVKFNPVTKQLASCTANDFGLCVPEEKSVTRTRVGARILCCDWTHDGQHLALGLYSGQVSIRDQTGQEKVCIERNAPVWTLAWHPARSDQVPVLAVGCWDSTLSFYQVSGIQLGKDRKLDFDPCTVSYFDNGNYLLVGGSDRRVTLYSRDGIRLTEIAETDDWCWVSKGQPGTAAVAAGSNSGAISLFKLSFAPVNGLYQDRFAYTENMTDVVVQHLSSEQKVRIKSRDYVKKVALYRNRLAIQQPDKIVIYELSNESDPFDLRYRVRDKIYQKLECNLLVVTSLHVILCHDKKLQMFDFSGRKEKEWSMESMIRYMKVVGGPAGKEGLLVGLKNGVVLRLFVDNPFPIQLIKHRETIRCLDLSQSRTKLAVVDSKGDCVVYDLESQEEVFADKNAWSVAWNSEFEDMLCYSGDGTLSIKTGAFPVHRQAMEGIVVGFKGSKIFSLQAEEMETVDVPQSASLYRYLDAKDYTMAYKVACLGVTESDWRFLGLTALQGLELEIARKAFIRVRDLKYIELINSIEQERRQRNRACDAEGQDENEKRARQKQQGLHLAMVMAYQGRFQEAAKLYTKFGHADRAVDMFSDLRQWEEAKTFAAGSASVDVQELIQRQGEWAQETGDVKLAAEMYCAAGQYDKAVRLVGEAGMLDELIEVARVMDAKELVALRKCADYFRHFGHHQYAKEVYLKMNDVQSLMKLHVTLNKWEDAFLLSAQHGNKYAEDVYLPYAQWLAEHDRFDEAQVAFKKADRPEKSMLMLKELSQSAITEQRYEDAAYYLWLLSGEQLSLAGAAEEFAGRNEDDGEEKRPGSGKGKIAPKGPGAKHLQASAHFQSLAQQYFAYGIISRYTDEPFSSLEPETVFNAGRFLMNVMGPQAPYGISRAAILWAVGKEGETFGAYKLARHAFDKLGHLRVPESWLPQIDLETMLIQSKPYSDREEQHFICYRCSTTNPLVHASAGPADCCVQCAHPFIRSLKSFDLLPLVEFAPEAGMSDEEAFALLRSEPVGAQSGSGPETSEEEKRVDRISFEETTAPQQGGTDSSAFSAFLFDCDFSQQESAHYRAVEVPAQVLKQTPLNEIFVIRWPAGRRWQFFKNIMPDVVPILKCPQCHSFFHEEDLETVCLSNGNKCPLCKFQLTI
ncbi:Intraflagellar transport protein 122-like [Hondaea fermentalgiana]|uniref:Intraflagellar transport protein 122 homolog n=1 Tax=Hondaea fermentalgiana TaxID=2315210 RepID=A0A2R5GTD8_9STRA|nr:Intraflagellar transport protein 122-like [Hondaea fermentalgiana]|eukprot:GBG34100.1 Intraflagellar transport protein 122-like [Hondaea fermentalgiana]